MAGKRRRRRSNHKKLTLEEGSREPESGNPRKIKNSLKLKATSKGQTTGNIKTNGVGFPCFCCLLIGCSPAKYLLPEPSGYGPLCCSIIFYPLCSQLKKEGLWRQTELRGKSFFFSILSILSLGASAAPEQQGLAFLKKGRREGLLLKAFSRPSLGCQWPSTSSQRPSEKGLPWRVTLEVRE